MCDFDFPYPLNFLTNFALYRLLTHSHTHTQNKQRLVKFDKKNKTTTKIPSSSVCLTLFNILYILT